MIAYNTEFCYCNANTDELHRSDIEKRDNEITDLKSNLSEEIKQRNQAETSNKELSEKLVSFMSVMMNSKFNYITLIEFH